DLFGESHVGCLPRPPAPILRPVRWRVSDRKTGSRTVRFRAPGSLRGSPILAAGPLNLPECPDLHGAGAPEKGHEHFPLRAEGRGIPDFGKIRIHQRIFGVIYTR